MFARVLTSLAVVLLCAQVSWAQASSSSPSRNSTHAAESHGASTLPDAASLAGTWKATTERLPLTGDFNEKVWGKNAASVRDVTLVVQSSGDATLTIARKVVDARGRTVAGSPSVQQADVTIGTPKPGLATRVDHDVKVVKAERRYPDNAGDTWELKDLRVNVVSFTDQRNALEVRFEPSDGQGAFSVQLSRATTKGSRK